MRKWMYTRQGGWKLDEFNIHHLAVSYRWHLTTANDCVRRLHICGNHWEVNFKT